MRQDYNAGIFNGAAGAVRHRPASTNHNSPDQAAVDIDFPNILILLTQEDGAERLRLLLLNISCGFFLIQEIATASLRYFAGLIP